MSSATSISASTGASSNAALRPWQFFLLAGMLAATAVVVVATGQSVASIILLSLTVVAASFVALGAYRVLAPLVVPESAVEPPTIVGRTRAGLEREKTLVLRSIKELEFDFAMGKITRGDFDEMSSKLRARAIGLMRQLDAGGGYRSLIEEEIERRVAGLKSRATGADSIPVAAAMCSCGAANDSDARFCKYCGAKLAVDG
jgi:hypothetical protein